MKDELSEKLKKEIVSLFVDKILTEEQIYRRLLRYEDNPSRGQIIRVIDELPHEIKRKSILALCDKMSRKRKRLKALKKIRREEALEDKYHKVTVGINGVMQYNKNKHTNVRWHNDSRHNQNYVRVCGYCGCLFHPLLGWENSERHCSLYCTDMFMAEQAKTKLTKDRYTQSALANKMRGM